MASELALLEGQLKPLAPQFADVLEGLMSPDRLIRTVVIAAEKVPKILQCDRQTLFNAAMSAAVLGLEPDGVTGQSFILPFAKRAQLVIGYKGYNTLAARSGLTITGEVVREGDEFDYDLGSKSFIHHKPKLGNTGRIIASWACAAALDRPPIISILSIDEILAIKETSPGGSKSDSPWQNKPIGFPAMASKSSKRRLARSTPLISQNPRFHLAARMDEAFEEQGRSSFIDGSRQLHVADSPIAEREPAEQTPTAEVLIAPKADKVFDALKAEAEKGIPALETEWFKHPSADRTRLKKTLEDVLKPIAWAADEAKAKGTPAETVKPETVIVGEIIEPEKPAAPTDDATYRAHAEAWIAKQKNQEAGLDKWSSDPEKALRTECQVTAATREHCVALIRKIAA